MRCFFCPGPAHPATGHQYTPTVLACASCTRDFFAWVRDRTNAKGARPRRPGAPRADFYAAAVSLTPRVGSTSYALRNSPPPPMLATC